MRLVFTIIAVKNLQAMPTAEAKRIREAFQQVVDTHPQRMPFVTEMAGQPSHWRLRKGNWRAIYRLIGDDLTVLAVEKRGTIYR